MERVEETFEKKKRAAGNDIFEEIKAEEKNNKDKKAKRNKKGKKIREDNGEEGEENKKVNKPWKENKNFDSKRDLKSEKFETYYRIQLAQYFDNEDQFQNFIDKMREKLPCILRINTANPYWMRFKEMLTDPDLVKNFLGGDDYGIKISPKNLTNLPQWLDLIYNINIPRFEFKKTDNLKNFHKFIQKSVDAGLISRQEAVSMIPPMLMCIEKTDKVFDMCAAPGSKTAQFLEVFYKNFDFLNPDSLQNDTGFVIANDNNWDRAHMMTHQLKRLNTAGMAVISHDAQHFPYIYQGELFDERILFDKILADVPCSSDAVLRKLPHRWRKWSPRDSFSLHKLQLQIIKRGISLLKVGGTIVYSTCSLNPIENEAIVAEVMNTFKNCLEIVDMSYAFEGADIRIRPGLTNWKVFVDDKSDTTMTKLIELKNKDDPLFKEHKDIVEESCFPPDEDITRNNYKLQNCIRLFPHDSDTSGFFITVFKLINPVNTAVEKSRAEKKVVNSEKGISFTTEDQEIVNWLKNYYGLTDKFPFDQLISPHSKISKKLNFVSKGVSNLLKQDRRNQLKVVNFGVKLFSLNKRKNVDDNPSYCRYRICQDGLIYAIPFMTKRIFFCVENTFKQIIIKGDFKTSELDDEEFIKAVSTVVSGCAVIVHVKSKPQFENGLDFSDEKYIPYLKENYVDAICCYTSPTRLLTMINKEHHHVFNMKYNIEDKK